MRPGSMHPCVWQVTRYSTEEPEMHYAISVPNGGECAEPAILAELAQVAEAAGWDAMLLEDYLWYHNATYHSTPGAPTHDPWIALAAMALRTTRLRLGTCVTPLSRWRPWHLARVTMSFDHLSGGRLILGVGLGDLADKGFTHVGEVVENRTRAKLLDEGLAILTGLWRGAPYSFQGERYQVRQVTFLPPPIQQPRIPIWVGGAARTPAVIRRAAQYEGICPYKLPDTDQWADFTPEDIRTLRAELMRQRETDAPFDIVIGGRPRAEDWDQERQLIQALAEAGATWWHEWVPAADVETMRAAIARGPLRPH
jgi:alkanesulfonate monooxygenase SsuD/methylene tetrahydromethanopterin reductase-like flavin-dependent oxidoreductase (luciferase family)